MIFRPNYLAPTYSESQVVKPRKLRQSDNEWPLQFRNPTEISGQKKLNWVTTR
jgi:hypothetical protein